MVVAGNVARALYFIEAGEICEISLVDSRNQFVTQLLTEGSFFGETSVLTGQLANSSFRVHSYMSMLHALSKKAYLELAEDFPEFQQSLAFAMNMRNMKQTNNVSSKLYKRPQTPPPGRSWAQVRNRVNKFQMHFETVMGRSRTLQATQYNPTPLNVDGIKLPKTMSPVVEFCAHNFHEVWVARQAQQRMVVG